MVEKDIIMMSRDELKRLHVLRQTLDNNLSQVKAAQILDLSDRQIRRIIKRLRDGGEAAIVHKARGKPSNRKLPDDLKARTVKLYNLRYHDFGPTLAHEKLFEKHKIKIGLQTLRNWLIDAGQWHKKIKRYKYRQWRQRRECAGELVQMDGSHHDWLEGRGPYCVLMGYIDDATSRVYGRFYSYEGTIPAMDSFKHYAVKYGLPQAVYLDKHTTYKSPAKQSINEEIANIKPMSEFERAMDDLGVNVIHANSPQAKGRIERLFKTLQDRVVKEMRLAQIKTIEEANCFLEEYLTVYNSKFSRGAVNPADMHRPIKKITLDNALCFKKDHALRNDYTVMHNRKLYQVLDRTITKQVTVENRLNGKQYISYNGQRLKYKIIEHRPIKQEPPKPDRKPVPRQQNGWKPMYTGYNTVKATQRRALEDMDSLILSTTETGHF
jgi:transposase